jgi:threonine/homoserine/homoserine lactone efflux protein
MEAFLTVTVFLFLPALYPWFMHPKTRRRPEGKWILLGMGAVAAGIAALGYSPLKALDAIFLLIWWIALVAWSVTATVARVRYRRQRRIADRLRAQFDRGPGVTQ